ncbi:MAG: MBL fold metallo-hydrolase, partial [Polyangiaceae bacterium]|nr:MBL fold metallo-hydrolase [Polyangiaceae bacterium]
HDYQPNDRPLRFETTIGASKRANVQLRAETTQEEFVRFREARDKTLAPPRLIFPSVQLNVNAGKPFPPHANGRSYLSIPLNLFRR